MVRWIKEPLFHFIIAGLLLFVAYHWLNRGETHTTRTIRISSAEINWLNETWVRQWHRPASEEEMRGLVNAYIKETILAHEARDLGLEENDTVIRRRLAQKMEFLLQDTNRIENPQEDELRGFYATHSTRYQSPARLTFTQIFFKSLKSAQNGLTVLTTQPPEELGDNSLIEPKLVDVDLKTISSLYGEQFGHEIFKLKADQWYGPIVSGYGYHLVHIDSIQAASPLTFEAVRTQVLTDWQTEQQTKAEAKALTELQKKYRIVFDQDSKSITDSLKEPSR